MSSGEVTHGLSLVPSIGANEVDLHEFVTHVDGNRIMRTQGYVVNANGYVDPSTLAHHRFVVLEIEHRSASGTPLRTYFIRIDRRAERHVSALKFVRRLGNVKSSDRVVLSYETDRLLAPNKEKQLETGLKLDHPLCLDRLGLMLAVIQVEFADYRLTKENCWAMTSVILELSKTEGRGTFVCGKICFPEWAPEVRQRIRNRFASALRALVPIALGDDCAVTGHDTTDDQQSSCPDPTTPLQVSEADDLVSRIGELAILDQSHPPPPVCLFGRDDYVQEIVELMKSKVLSGASARLVIGGPGGIGKTYVALAIFHSPELDGTFPPARRFFVPCQSITTASTFISAIASSLGVKTSQGDALTLVMEKLKSESAPLMLLLDNGESFWFDYEIQPHARTILRHICSVRVVTLLLTIRGTERPNVTIWDPLPLLGPLSLQDAQQAFCAIATDIKPDASLDRLLKLVDYVPLAVTLLARRCQITGESAGVLCDGWEKGRTELLKLGEHKPDDNLDISIKLSLESPLMRSNHNALRLLSVVSYLPSGIPDKACSSIPLSDEELSAAEFLLRRLSLAYSPALGWITTLEPIRVYMRRHKPPPAGDLSVVENWHINLANTHGKYSPGDAEFPAASAKLTVNSANITFILRTHIQQREGLACISEAVLAFSYFLYWTRPNGDVLEMLLSAGTNVLDHSTKGQCLRRLGDILRMQDKYEEAQSRLKDGRSEFIAIGDQLGAAQCLRSLGDILKTQQQHEEAQSKLEKARSEFTDIGDQLGAAHCLRSLGDILRMQHRHEEAQLKLEEARSEFTRVNDRLGAVQCLRLLGEILRMQHQHKEAQSKLEEACTEFASIGNQTGVAQCLKSLGNILLAQDKYKEAQSKLEKAQSEFANIGDRLGTAQCLRGLGDILEMWDQYEEAKLKQEQARSEFIVIGNRLGAAQCLRSLGDILRMQDQKEEAKMKLEEARSEFDIIGDRLGAAECLQSLGDILRMQHQYEEAQLKMEEAVTVFTTIGDRLRVAECLLVLGEMLRMQGQYEEAQLHLVKACSEFNRLGSQRHADWCQNRLDAIAQVHSVSQVRCVIV